MIDDKRHVIQRDRRQFLPCCWKSSYIQAQSHFIGEYVSRQVSKKTVNHDLKALKMLFKSARRDSAITEDPTEFVETVRKERGIKIKRPFTLPELRSVLDLANDEIPATAQRRGSSHVGPVAGL
jgi:site-specific recombinase XerD